MSFFCLFIILVIILDDVTTYVDDFFNIPASHLEFLFSSHHVFCATSAIPPTVISYPWLSSVSIASLPVSDHRLYLSSSLTLELWLWKLFNWHLFLLPYIFSYSSSFLCPHFPLYLAYISWLTIMITNLNIIWA